MNTLTKKSLGIILLLLVIVTSIVIGLGKIAQSPKEKITIADAQLPVFALIYVADKKGYFKGEGLEVTYNKFDLGKNALADVIKGHSDLATVFETPIVKELYEGEKLSVISTLHTSTKNTGLVGLKSHGINQASDLKGKKIAVTKGINAEFFLYSLLTIEGINTSDVTIIDMTAAKAVTALQEGSIDAAAIYNPFLYQAQHASNASNVTTIYSDVYTEISTLTGKKEFVTQNEKKLIKVLKALVKAEQFTQNNQEETIKIVDDWLPNLNEQDVRNQWNSFTTTLVLNNLLLTVMTREAQFYHDLGVYQSDVPNIRDAIETSYLKEVKHEGVTLY